MFKEHDNVEKTRPVSHHIAEPWWGLKRNITPCFGAHLVQEGHRLHYLADRAGISGTFSDSELCHLDQAFPLLMKQLELMLASGELTPRHQHCVSRCTFAHRPLFATIFQHVYY
ncbi:type IV toxin-antitoxin system YeeU family antitoxin [Trabulsiella odontotermitis]|uniref:type IV toxin-antitoxin system YeeU family antitoxin n=1 Tax=Trabulsiella odontotermitis TaxID=379893 RepID=UPI003AD48A74